MAIVVRRLDHAQIIHVAIAIEVEVGESRIGVIEHLLKLLKVLGLTEKRGNRLEVEVLRNVGRSSGHGDRLIRPGGRW